MNEQVGKPKDTQTAEVGASTWARGPVNRKERRALKHGHTLRPKPWEDGYCQRIRNPKDE